MTFEEKMNRLSETIAETNRLFSELTEELATSKESEVMENPTPINTLQKYIDTRNTSDDVYYINEDSEVRQCVVTVTFSTDVENPYDVYVTEALARQAQKIKKFNDLCLAFKYCYDNNYQPNWSNYEYKYYVVYDVEDNIYYVEQFQSCCGNIVYFSCRELAQKLADYLNEIDPDGDMVK